jgi:hypothetical protein
MQTGLLFKIFPRNDVIEQVLSEKFQASNDAEFNFVEQNVVLNCFLASICGLYIFVTKRETFNLRIKMSDIFMTSLWPISMTYL